MQWRTWRAAMSEALYGDEGFYRAAGVPGRHFRTAAHTSPLWAQAWLVAAERVAAAVGTPFTLLDMGAGGGELLAELAAIAPTEWRLVGVDIAPRPPGLPERVEWTPEPPPTFQGLCVATEWLDVVPVDVVERTADALRLVEVDRGGVERLGPPPAEDQLAWLRRWWPVPAAGQRAEIGLDRDRAWHALVARLSAGVAVAVDYAADPGRQLPGTLTGYRDGRQVRPVPDGTTDLTAHVVFESLPRVGTDVDVLSQRAALRRLGVTARVPAYAGNPTRYAGQLAAAAAAAELLDPGGLGGFTWLVQPVGSARLWAPAPT